MDKSSAPTAGSSERGFSGPSPTGEASCAVSFLDFAQRLSQHQIGVAEPLANSVERG
jgi:hypothetical protein